MGPRNEGSFPGSLISTAEECLVAVEVVEGSSSVAPMADGGDLRPDSGVAERLNDPLVMLKLLEPEAIRTSKQLCLYC